MMNQHLQQAQDGEGRMNAPRLLVCPVCNAQPGHACSVPTDTGRRNVPWYHFKREEAQ